MKICYYTINSYFSFKKTIIFINNTFLFSLKFNYLLSINYNLYEHFVVIHIIYLFLLKFKTNLFYINMFVCIKYNSISSPIVGFTLLFSLRKIYTLT